MPSIPPLPPDRPDLAERYGVVDGGWRTRLPLVAVAVVFAVMLGATAWGLLERYTGVRAGVVAYGDITETSITITLQVVRPPDVPVVCDVAAVGENQIDVGAAQIAVPAGEPDEVIVSTIIETATPPKAARLLACRPADTDVATPSAAVATDVVAADAV